MMEKLEVTGEMCKVGRCWYSWLGNRPMRRKTSGLSGCGGFPPLLGAGSRLGGKSASADGKNGKCCWEGDGGDEELTPRSTKPKPV